MISEDVPHFPRGFTLGLADPPVGYERGPLLRDFFVHPWAELETAGDGELFVIIVGAAVPTVGEDEAPARSLLEHLRRGEREFLSALDQYSGRHAILFGSDTDPKVVTDATGMRTVFYSAGVIASHAVLVEEAVSGDATRGDLPFKYGYPGNRTPYANTRVLTPNTYLEINTGQMHRFWPRSSPEERTVEEAASELLSRSATALQRVARSRPVKMALTAGLDSRTLLAIAIHSGIDFETYTYGHGGDTRMDRNLAADLARVAGRNHTLIPRVTGTDGLRERLDEAHYGPHHQQAVGQLREWITDKSTAAVTAHLLETGGRNFVKTRVIQGKPTAAPNEASAMARLHFLTMEPKARHRIVDWGRQRYFEEAEAAFQEYIDLSEYQRTAGLVDAFDQFYWEHRMGSWHGPAMVERDFYAEAFIPFNSRSVFEAMLGVPQPEKLSGAVLQRLIQTVDPGLLDLPINPKEWPPPV